MISAKKKVRIYCTAHTPGNDDILLICVGFVYLDVKGQDQDGVRSFEPDRI